MQSSRSQFRIGRCARRLLALLSIVSLFFMHAPVAHAAPAGAIDIIEWGITAPEPRPGAIIQVEWKLSAKPRRLELRYSPWMPLAPYAITTVRLPARATGSYALRIPASWAKSYVELAAMSVGLRVDGVERDRISVNLICPTDWFFGRKTPACPGQAAEQGPAAVENFEHGRMLWIQKTRTIFAFYTDGPRAGQYDVFLDTWDESQTERDPAIVPPGGRVQPKRGFGKIWRERRLVDTLGWALDEERGYTANTQSGRYAFKQSIIFIADQDGAIIELITDPYGPLGTWRLLPP